MLASYTSGDFGLRFASLSELEHVQYVLDAMIEIHGEVARCVSLELRSLL